jgi:hypothetical protein
MAKAKSPRKSSNGSANGKEAQISSAIVSESNAAERVAESAAAIRSEGNNSEPKNLARKAARSPEIGKAEARSNLVPINLEDEIRQLAYLMSERRGFLPGHETEDWLAAEHEVLHRYRHQHSA